MLSQSPHARSHMTPEIAQRYWEGMDRSMPSKLALMSGLMLLDDGATVVDAGCGSGAAAYHLAKLNPQAKVIGIDLDPVAIEASRERYQLPNLTFETGDVSKPLPVRANAILSSSTLHHVFTFSEPAYSVDAVEAALAAHADSLKEGGVLAVRDFVIPEAPDLPVHLWLRDEGKRSGSPTEIDEASLLEFFAATARPRDLVRGPGFPIEELSAQGGWRRFRLTHHAATEFLLRKNYRADWEAELHEQYGYFTQGELLKAFARAGLGDARAIPVYNAWIIDNRWRGHAVLQSEDGAQLPWPATNILVTGRKIAKGAHRVKWHRSLRPAGYLKPLHMSDASGEVWSVIKRPVPAFELLPFVIADGRVRILARDGHPRPLATAADHLHPGRAIEPLAFAEQCSPQAALSRLRIDESLVLGSPIPLLSYLPSAGGIAESAEAWAVQLRALPAPCEAPPDRGFSRGATIRSFDAQDILRAGQAGSLDEARLEIATAFLLRSLNVPLEPWTGDEIAITTPDAIQSKAPPTAWPHFEPVSEPARPWMTIRRGLFQDLGFDGGVLGESDLEWAEPTSGWPVTVSLLPAIKSSEGRVRVGLEHRSLPAAQILLDDPHLICVPAWRVAARPRTHSEAAHALMRKLSLEKAPALVPLGGPYYSSLGVTTERVFPFIVHAAQLPPQLRDSLEFRDLADLVAEWRSIADGHLLISLSRAAHICSGLPSQAPTTRARYQ